MCYVDEHLEARTSEPALVTPYTMVDQRFRGVKNRLQRFPDTDYDSKKLFSCMHRSPIIGSAPALSDSKLRQDHDIKRKDSLTQ